MSEIAKKSIQEILSSLPQSKSMVIDGCMSVEAPDKAAETLSIKGADISSMVGGTLNRDHAKIKEHGWESVVGKCIYAKKIFTAKDCETKREKLYWNKWELPYIYVIFRMLDGAGHAEAKSAAAVIRDAFEAGEELLFLSIDGKTIEQDGNELKTTMARDCALTDKPCNAACCTGLLADPVIGYFYDEKSDNSDLDVKKSLEAGNYNTAPSNLTQGAALQRESIGSPASKSPSKSKKKKKVGLQAEDPLSKHEDTILDLYEGYLELQNLVKAGTPDKAHLPTIHLKDDPSIKFHVLGQDPNFYYLRHHQDDSQDSPPLKVRRHEVAQHFDTKNIPRVDIKTDPNMAVLPFTHDTGALALLNGINLSHKSVPPGHYREGVSSNYPDKPYWTKNASGKAVYIKHNIPEDLPKQVEEEAIYNHIAKKYMGLGAHLPVTAVFKHPITGRNTLAVEGLPSSSHLKKFRDIEKGTEAPIMDHAETLGTLGSNGTLDKMFITDYLLGKRDRTNMNMLFNDKDVNKFHLIDNSTIFDSTKDMHSKNVYPKYSFFYDKINPSFNQKSLDWFKSIQFPEIVKDLGKMGVNYEQIAGIMSRYEMIAKALKDPSGGRQKLWHGGYV